MLGKDCCCALLTMGLGAEGAEMDVEDPVHDEFGWWSTIGGMRWIGGNCGDVGGVVEVEEAGEEAEG